MKLAISLATRNRPALLRDTLTRTLANIQNKNTSLVIMADADDAPTIAEAERIIKDVPCVGQVSLNVREREDTVAAKWNRVLEEPADVYTYACDDCAHVTPGFDDLILKAASLFPDGLGFVLSPLCNASFAHTYALTAPMVAALGYLFPPYFPYWFVDHWIDDIARLTQRIAVANWALDATKSPPTMEMREPAWWATWFDAAYLIRRKIAHDIIHKLDEPDWRKEMICSQYPLVEYRSRWVNESVRAQFRAGQLSARHDLNDPRYQRVRARAVEMVPQLLEGLSPQEATQYRFALTPPTTVPALPRAFSANNRGCNAA